jgi:hypothetical protein
MRLPIYAAFAAFLLAGTSVNAAPFPSAGNGQLPVSESSSSTTRVENVLDPLLEPFQQSASGSCSTAGDCAVSLPATTHANTLIRHMSCSFAMPTNAVEIEAYLSGDGGNTFNFLPIASATPTGFSTTIYLVNTEAYYFVAKGNKPKVDVITGVAGAGSILCTFAGYTT